MKPAVLLSLPLAAAIVVAQPASFKVAFYNIRSGWGAQPLKGHAGSFADNANCTHSDQPMNAWGNGVVQKALVANIKDDPSVVALGLAEAWVCASPQNVRKVLAWKTATEERNGTALLARYGFSGGADWLQLDTSRNKNPKDTMWVVGARVCIDPKCRSTVHVFSTHWSGTGPDGPATFDRQAAATIELMKRDGDPHVLVGDLNIFEGGPVCHQQPNNNTLGLLRAAGYTDVWPAIHGTAEGYTGMANRAGCGQPEGYAWKRIDYAWSKGFTPAAMDRFGMAPPGDASPSDHYGIIAGFQQTNLRSSDRKELR